MEFRPETATVYLKPRPLVFSTLYALCNVLLLTHRFQIHNTPGLTTSEDRERKRDKCRQISSPDSLPIVFPIFLAASFSRPSLPLGPSTSSRIRCRVVFSKQFALVIFSASAAADSSSGKIGIRVRWKEECFTAK